MNEDKIREIDIKDLLFYLLFRWRSLLICGLIGVIILGGFKFYQAETKRRAYVELNQNGEDATAVLGTSYSTLKTTLQKTIRKIRTQQVGITGKEAEIKTAQGKINEKKDDLEELALKKKRTQMKMEETDRKLSAVKKYISESLYMSLDSAEHYVAERTYQVILDEDAKVTRELYRDPADAIVVAYSSAIDVGVNLKELAEKYQIQEKYIRELFTIEKETTANTVTVRATGSDSEMAGMILNTICSAIEDRKDEIASGYQSHELKCVADTDFVMIDNSLLDEQNKKQNLVLDYTTTIDGYTSDLMDIETKIVNINADIETLEANIENLRNDIAEMNEDIQNLEKTCAETEEEIKKKIPSVSSVRKATLKYGLIGLFSGLAVLAVFYCLAYLLNGRIHTADEISHYFGLPVFAILAPKQRNKQCLVDRLLYRWAGCDSSVTDEEALGVSSVTVGALTENMKSVVILGKGNKDRLMQAASKLKENIKTVDFIPVAEVGESQEEVVMLRNCDAVILYAVRNSTKVSDITAEMEHAKLLEKKILGFIIA